MTEKYSYTEKYKILEQFIKDMSSETPNIETYLYVRENISKYQLGIDINSKAVKDKHIEVNTTLKFEDKNENNKKSYFEIVLATIVRISDEVKDGEKNSLLTQPLHQTPGLDSGVIEKPDLVPSDKSGTGFPSNLEYATSPHSNNSSDISKIKQKESSSSQQSFEPLAANEGLGGFSSW